jgi:hypothetical protein
MFVQYNTLRKKVPESHMFEEEGDNSDARREPLLGVYPGITLISSDEHVVL